MNSNYIGKQFILALALTISSSELIYAQKILKFSDHQPLGEMRTNFLKEVFFPAIERESNGRLKVEAYWNGKIAKAYDALSVVSKGKDADMATTVPEYTSKELPLHQIFKSFPVGPSDNNQVSFFRSVYSNIPEFSLELEKNNIKQIFLSTGYPVAFYSTKNMKTLKDIEGHKWRSASFWHLDFLKNSGAIPIKMHWGSEVYNALKNKTLDGLMVNVDSGYNLEVYEHAPNVKVSKELWLGHLYPLVINLNTWKSLSLEDKQAINRAAESSYKILGNTMKKNFERQLLDLKKVGATVELIDKKEVYDFRRSTKYQEVQKKWIIEQEEKGIKNAGEVLNKVTILLNNFLK